MSPKLITYLALVAGCLGAALWAWSAMIRIPTVRQGNVIKASDQQQLAAALSRAGRINTFAAAATALSLALQALATYAAP